MDYQFYTGQASLISIFRFRTKIWSEKIQEDLIDIIEELLQSEFQLAIYEFKEKLTRFRQVLKKNPFSISKLDRELIVQLVCDAVSRASKPLKSLSIFGWHQLINWMELTEPYFNNFIQNYTLEKVVKFNQQNDTWVLSARKENEPFAIKAIHSTNELLALKHIGYHPHIIELCDSLIVSEVHFMVFPFISQTGEDMPKNSNIIRTCFYHLILALDFCHTKGFLHLDVKPANTLLELKSSPKLVLADFGFSVSLQSAKKYPFLTFVGSPQYSAPEILSGKGGNVEADIWSAGVTLADWIFRRSIFLARNEEQALASIRRFNFTSFPEPVVSDTNDLKRVLQSILIIDREKRIKTSQLLTLLTKM